MIRVGKGEGGRGGDDVPIKNWHEVAFYHAAVLVPVRVVGWLMFRIVL